MASNIRSILNVNKLSLSTSICGLVYMRAKQITAYILSSNTPDSLYYQVMSYSSSGNRTYYYLNEFTITNIRNVVSSGGTGTPISFNSNQLQLVMYNGVLESKNFVQNNTISASINGSRSGSDFAIVNLTKVSLSSSSYADYGFVMAV